MAKRLGVIPHLYAQPLFTRLQSREQSAFHLTVAPAGSLAVQLRQHQLDGAFLSPIDYAKEYSHYEILPDIGVASEGESETVYLVFRESIREISTLAIDPGSSTEIVLAHLVLAEKYDTAPHLLPFTGHSIDEALQQADAFLAVGDAALGVRERTNTIDLIDEWLDLTDLPFVHGMWVIQRDAFTDDEIRTIIGRGRQGVAERDSLTRDNLPPDYLGHFDYTLTSETFSALGEFYRMAYYHGIIPDIPDIVIHPLPDPGDDS